MKRIIYIKVYQGYIEARTLGKNNEEVFNSNGLNHPRTLAGSFIEVKKTFKEAISKQPKLFFGLIKPIVMVHLVPKMEGGYTDLELRFFREVGYSGGASRVYLLADHFTPLSDSSLINITKQKEKFL